MCSGSSHVGCVFWQLTCWVCVLAAHMLGVCSGSSHVGCVCLTCSHVGGECVSSMLTCWGGGGEGVSNMLTCWGEGGGGV